MSELSILIPARNEIFLAKTIEDILQNIEGDTEIIAVLDGYWADPPVPQHERVTIIHNPESVGQRAATNQAAKLSKAKYLMKVDAHCAFDRGFDVKMMEAMHDDWTMAPLMKNLHAFDWVCPDGHRRYQGPSGPCRECGKETTRDVVWIAKSSPKSVSYCFDSTPHFQYFGDWAKRPEGQGDITESMSLQGSCFMLTRDKFHELNVCDEAFGSWGSQGIEVAAKTWLSGGQVMINKKTWYAHMFRTQGGDFSFPYPISGRDQEKAKKYARELFFNNNWPLQKKPLSWLVEKFWPVRGWTEDDLAKLKANKFKFKEVEPPAFVPQTVTSSGKKGIIFYTDNELAEEIAKPVRDQLLAISKEKNIPIVSSSLIPMDFGKNIHSPELKRGMVTLFTQILRALEASDADIIFFCFQGNTHIETVSGQKRIDKIEVGELVKTHLGRYRPVTKVFARPYKQRSPIVQIDTQFSSIKCTPEHPFYVYTKNQKEWVPASRLEIGDMLLYPSENRRDYLTFDVMLRSSTSNGGYGKMNIKIGRLEVDRGLARFMGMYLAEGHFNGKNGIGFTFNNNEKEYQDFVEKICYEKFKRRSRKRIQWSTQILININQLGPLFKKWFGGNTANKRVPEFVFSWNINNRLSFIKGFLEGDGSKSINDDSFYGFNVAGKKMVKDMVTLMNMSGVGWDNSIKERLQTKFNSKEYFTSKKVYSINYSRIVFRKLMDILNSDWIDNSNIGIPIQDIKQAKMSSKPRFSSKNGVRDVYNLQVEEDNSYIAQSVIVHNCEHDVLYHPSHFDFIPKRRLAYYYNVNVWKVRLTDGHSLKVNDIKQLSGLVGYRKNLISHFQRRLEMIEKTHKVLVYEPGTYSGVNAVDDRPVRTWQSAYPNIDIRHDNNFTKSRWKKEEFKDKKYTFGWTESTADKIPGWNNLTGILGIKPQPPAFVPQTVTSSGKKGIIFYTDNALDSKIAQTVQKQIKSISDARQMPIVSASLKKMDFGREGFVAGSKNIYFPSLKRSPESMFKQIMSALEHSSSSDIVFLCEHDVLYHPSHFDFTPPDKDTFYYNQNVWMLRTTDGHALHYDVNQVSGLCGYREALLTHYRERYERVLKEGFSRKMGYEPMTHNRIKWKKMYKLGTWKSPYPNVDIKHEGNLTGQRWKKEDFRNQRLLVNWQETDDEIPGWGKTKELVKKLT
ncbi:hypothetical protein A2803_05235 [Candidatus Woesebacteria bacterium RIFCSPHIGHO2_01_FULL_44_21]|uniref:DOD-type homing endonuclease domain-containing protein n=1 Tax=Candidatus Woesebacteria bacterium RIFCSPHIGHO2_01_FULL_44_21 TaxID=1802503 RepID=A0A1F7YW97_9BACT|nr:MAG: hypothetical protein A2803_05235 [Candidatus Woesebacteria bacterium RIFCSPHIGHO2_01_FULL_44_21]OGM69078.1 MAG: hypothetical protein A2897_04580 [Candidatus Woesebacteria bacterium RIFCSPLOWO2_01_FULL_44_24b]